MVIVGSGAQDSAVLPHSVGTTCATETNDYPLRNSWTQTGFGLFEIDGHNHWLVVAGCLGLRVERVRVGQVLELWLGLLTPEHAGLLGHLAERCARHTVLGLLYAFGRVNLPRGHRVEVWFGRVTPPHALANRVISVRLLIRDRDKG